jgi:hypothetical protein
MSHEVCLCGHPADDHSALGFCEIEGCECESSASIAIRPPAATCLCPRLHGPKRQATAAPERDWAASLYPQAEVDCLIRSYSNLLGAIPESADTRTARAVGTAVEVTGRRDPMAHDPAATVLADRSYLVDRALEAVEHVPVSGRDQIVPGISWERGNRTLGEILTISYARPESSPATASAS